MTGTETRPRTRISAVVLVAVLGACQHDVAASCGSCRETLMLGGSKKSAPASKPVPRQPSSHKFEQPGVPLGLNLGTVNYYATAIPFVDVWKMADPFQSANAVFVQGDKNPWNTEVAEKIPRDAAGYPLEIPARVPGVSAPQMVRASVVSAVYSGRYTLLYDGDGEIEFPASPVQVVSSAPGKIELDVQAKPDSSLFLAIKRSNKSNHVRNIRLLLPGFAASYAQQIFHPTYLAKLKGVSTLRFMDWGRTNGSELAHWADRPTPDMPQGVKGVSLETMIDLANRAGTDAWFCVPHMADDQYVEEMAKLIKTRLDPAHRAYIEYSNELWNGIFPQVAWTAKKGCAAKLNEVGAYTGDCDDDGPRYWSGLKWQVRRSGQIFKIFDQVFGGEAKRVVRVIAGQAQYTELNEKLVSSFDDPKVNTARAQADALAVAPYAGGGVASSIVEDGKKDTINVLQILDLLEKDIGPAVVQSTRANKKMVDQYGLALIAYEGGQHLVAYGDASHDERFVGKLIEAQRLPRMGQIYQQLLDAWYKESGDGLMVLFNYAEAPTKFGSWGLLENQEQRPEQAPKYKAFMDRLQKLSFNAAERRLKAAGSTPPPGAASAPTPNPPPTAAGPAPTPPPGADTKATSPKPAPGSP
ncbi:MAG TPA: hypothetical protein VJV78_30295 [Polyangiales bacterium]|nr:hypothetical protein [Polyangiales bacterium]